MTLFRSVDLFEKHQPDVTLMDLRLPGLSGIEAITNILAKFSGARIIVAYASYFSSYPLPVRASHNQTRPSVTVATCESSGENSALSIAQG